MTPPKPQIPRAALLALAGIAAPFGLYEWAVFAATFHHDGAIGPRIGAPGVDWMAFYESARAYFEGNLPVIFDGQRFTAFQNEALASWLRTPMDFHPWIYPPHFLLLILPFGLLSFGASYAAFMLVTFGGLAWAVGSCAASPRQRWLLLISLLLSPAAAMTVIMGQNTFLTTALLIGGFALLRCSPIAAGMLFGVVSIKPTLALMIPVALLAAGQWRALAGAAAAFLLLALASLALFGPEAWRYWLDFVAFGSPSGDFERWRLAGQLWGINVFSCAVLLGAPPALATALQYIVALFSAGAVYHAFSRKLPRDRQLIVLCVATVLAAPHLLPYDTVLLAIAATLYAWRVVESDLSLLHLGLALTLWLAPLYNPPRTSPVGLATPLLMAALIVCALRERRARAPSIALAPN